MTFGQRAADLITEADLLDLIETKTSEGKDIDFKLLLPGKADGDRREFLYDVSSFANTLGGYLVFGMEESEGAATALHGLPDINPDEEIRRLEEMARDGIRPPIPGIQTAAVRLAVGSTAIVMSIPKSWNPPHQVTYQKSFRFYARDTNGKYQLDVDELRSVFVQSEGIAERMQQFRVNRISKIVAGDTLTTLPQGARVITHLLPLSAFGRVADVDLRLFGRDPRLFVPLTAGISYSRFNADGFAAWSEVAYAQAFRSGCLEVVSVYSGPDQSKNPQQFLPSVAFESRIFAQLKSGKEMLQSLSIGCPVVAMVSFVGIKGWRMRLSPAYATSPHDVFDRDPLLLSEILIETFDRPSVAEARPIVDAVWNAAGWPGSPHYGEDNQWDPNRL